MSNKKETTPELNADQKIRRNIPTALVVAVITGAGLYALMNGHELYGGGSLVVAFILAYDKLF